MGFKQPEGVRAKVHLMEELNKNNIMLSKKNILYDTYAWKGCKKFESFICL